MTAALIGLLVGPLFGSFLNVCIARLPRGESIVTPPSHCPQCQHPIRWYDNIPVLSWLLLRARCRDCHTRISWQYPAVELATGLWFAFAGLRMEDAWHPPAHALASYIPFWTFDTLGLAILGFLLIGLVVMDWQTQLLPDAFTLLGTAIGVFLVCLQAIFLEPGEDQITFTSRHLRLSSPGSFAARGNVFLTGPEALIFGRLAAIAGAALLLLLVLWGYRAIRKQEGMGLGDVKLLAMVAAFLGFKSALLTLFLGVILATLYALVLLAQRRANRQTALPFGSFLAVGGLLAALFSGPILAWYSTFFV